MTGFEVKRTEKVTSPISIISKAQMTDTSNLINFIRNAFGNGAIGLHEPCFTGNERNYVMDAIDSTYVSSVGKYVDLVEDRLAAITNTERSVAVVNGTAALQVALQLAGVNDGDEVITQSLTFVATANAITFNRATPVFLDVDEDTMGMSPTALLEFLQEFCIIEKGGCFNKISKKRIAACVPMHTFGFICRINEIVRICDEWCIPVIEDAAEALGSSIQGKAAGTFGKIGILSFNGNKIVTAGGGGALISNDANLMRRAKHLTTTARVPHAWEYMHSDAGYNFRMPNLNAALLCGQLETLPLMIESKSKLYKAYAEHLRNSEIVLREAPNETTWNHWLISIELKGRQERDKFLEETNASKISTRPIWQLLFRLPMYAHCYRDAQRNAEYLEERIVNLPSSAMAFTWAVKSR